MVDTNDKPPTQGFMLAAGLIFAANIETLLYFWLAYTLGQKLESYQILDFGLSWRSICYLVGMILVVIAWYRAFSRLFRMYKMNTKDHSEDTE